MTNYTVILDGEKKIGYTKLNQCVKEVAPVKESSLHRWLERGLDLLYPRKCPYCQMILTDPEQPLCTECQSRLPWLTGEEARREVDFTSGCFSPLRYQGPVPEAVHRYKFGCKRSYGPKFGLILAQCVQDQKLPVLDGVTWAPLSRRRLRKRGFDQAELLARETARHLELPVFSLLEKTRHTAPQSGLSGEAARRANALGAYSLRSGVDLRGRKLLLIDDVVTTGATLSECARLLRQEGAEVYCAALARAHRGT